MNTARSTLIGWAALIAGAGVSFVYAKKGINERRREQHRSGQRPAEIKDWRERIAEPPTPSTPQPGDATHKDSKR